MQTQQSIPEQDDTSINDKKLAQIVEDGSYRKDNSRDQKYGKRDTKVAFENFDSSFEDRRDERLVYKYIQKQDYSDLTNHLHATKSKFDIVSIHDKSGYTPLMYAAYKNHERACEILIDFVLRDEDIKGQPNNGGSGETGDPRVMQERQRETRREHLKLWLNQHSKGDDGFSALHFAAFHGNISMIRLLVKHGANVFAVNS